MTSPTKPPTLPHRVLRGGGWDGTTATVVLATIRYGNSPTVRYGDFGFRTTQSGFRQPLKG